MRKVLEATLLAGIIAGSIPTALAGGSSAGNGGDIVHCDRSSANSFEGDYFLDYLATYVESSSNRDIVQVKSWEQSRDRILKGLKEKHPEMALRFQDFVNGMENFTDQAQSRIWLEASFGLEYLDDQELYRKIPENCRGTSGKMDVTQFIRRSVRNGQVAYEFLPSLYRKLKEQRPLQFSFAVVHEFLWDYTDDPDLIRRMNRILHSSDFDRYDTKKFQSVITKLGLTGPTRIQPMIAAVRR